MESSREPLLGSSESFGDLLSAVGHAVGLGVWNYLPDTGRVHWSERAKEIFDIPPQCDWSFSEFLEHVHVLDRPRVREAITAALDPEVQAPFNVEYRLLTANGRTRWILVKGRAFFDGFHDSATEMSGIALDVTPHKHAEERLESIITSAHDAVVTTDLNDRIVDWNPAATRIYGYSATEMLGHTVGIMVPPEKAEQLREVYERARNGESVASLQTERIRKDGRRIQILLTVSPIVDSMGEVRGISKVAKDITDQLASEEKLRQAKRLEAIGLLAGGIAHDFNNLLTVINGYASRLLTQLPEQDETHRQLLYIEEAGTRARSLTQQLLAFSRKQILQPRVLSLGGVVKNLVPFLGRLIREDVEIVTRFGPIKDRVQIDQNQLEQMLLNLIVNASDAMPQGGRLTIDTSTLVVHEARNSPGMGLQEGCYHVLSISDTGTGITPDILPHIFDPFFTTKPVGMGTGLGLASVHGVAKQSGGHVAAYSEVGIGTTIRIYLPACDLEIDEAAKETSMALPIGGTETILVVEDDALLRRYATEVLADLGYTVIPAANGVEALEASRRAPNVDLLITDVVMPAMSGRQLAETLIQERPKLRVLYISGYSENTISQNRLLYPGVWYLAKPFAPTQLHRRVQEILQQSREARRVLVVDDDPAVRRIMAEMLGESGYTVVEATDGGRAMEIYGEQPIDLIMLDIVMPGQEGLETLRQLMKMDSTCPIVAMSGHPGYLNTARALGASATLTKPISKGTLIQSIRELVG